MGPLNSFNNSVGIFLDTYSYLKKAKQPHHKIENLKTAWSRQILSRLNVSVELIGTPCDSEPTLFVGNHISYLDIPLLINVAPQVSFVAKSELSRWPIFGNAAKAVDTVFVKRENKTSRRSARDSVKSALNKGKQIVIFPSGTTCTTESKPWKKGAFEIAEEAGFKIQPFRISYTPLRAVAYIDQDFFPTHLMNLFKYPSISAQIEFHEPSLVKNAAWDCQYWYYWSRGLIDVATHKG